MRTSYQSQHEIQNVKTHNRTTQKTRQNISNTNPTKNLRWPQVLTKGKAILLLRHPLCYSYIHSSLIGVAVIEERKHLRNKVKHALSFEMWILRNVRKSGSIFTNERKFFLTDRVCMIYQDQTAAHLITDKFKIIFLRLYWKQISHSRNSSKL
jgi:hypothetical protein